MIQGTSRKAAILSGIICIMLTISLVGAVTNYTSVLNVKDNTLTSKDSTINDLNIQITNKNSQIIEFNETISSLIAQTAENNNTITSLNAQITNDIAQKENLANQNTQLQKWLTDNITSLNAQIENLQNQIRSSNSQIITLQNQASTDQTTIANLQNQLTNATSKINSLNSIITTLQNQINDSTPTNNANSSQLQTLVFHVCEKGLGYSWGLLPNASQTYNQILAATNNSYNVLLLPEYRGHQSFGSELTWLAINFGGKQGIPIMLEVFGGGKGVNPVPMLSTSNISAAMAVSNVKWVRINELTSWYMENPAKPFPSDYITSILEFCRTNNLKVFWTEWKVEVFSAVQTYIKGYEDIVTVSFSTNSEFVEPADGFTMVSQMFQHWGGSVQAWYWEERTNNSLLNMPPALLIEHALLAKNKGVEILQLEPYWYFFDNGTANGNLKLLAANLT